MRAIDQAIPYHSRVLRQQERVVERPIRRFYITHASESAALSTFLDRDVELVRSDIVSEPQKPIDFYKGLDRGWACITDGLVIERNVVEDVIVKALTDAERRPDDVKFYMVKGPAGNGKTICLKQVGWHLATTMDCLVLWALKSSALNPEALEELAGLTGRRIFILVDRVAFSVTEVADLIRHAKHRNIPVTVIAAETDSEWNNYCASLDCFQPEEFRVRYLSRRETEALIDKLTDHNCLGLLAELSRAEQIKRFEERADRQLLVALHEVTQGRRFEEIVFEEYQRLQPASAKEMYLDICTLNQFGAPVRAGTISRVSSIVFEDYKERLFKPLENVVITKMDPVTHDMVYLARHSRVANFVFRLACNTDAEKVHQLLKIMRHLDIGYSSDRAAFERITKGRSLVRMLSDPSQGRRLFETATKVAPDAAFVFQQWAIFESNLVDGSGELAQRCADMARDLDPRSKAVIHTQAEVARKRARSATAKIDRDRLRAVCREHLDEIRDPDGRYVLATRGKLLCDELRDLSREDTPESDEKWIATVKLAEAVLARAQQLFPDDSEFYQIEAELRSILKQHRNFVAALEHAVRSASRNDTVAVRLASAYRDDGRTEQARTTLESSLEQYPDSKPIHLALARLLLAENSTSHDRVEQHLQRSFDRGDSNFEARHLYAQFLFLVGRVDESSALFDFINENAPMEFRRRPSREKTVVEELIPRASGVVSNKSETYLFVRSGVYNRDIYANERNSDFEVWNAITKGSDVTFEVRFDRRGPTAVALQVSK